MAFAKSHSGLKTFLAANCGDSKTEQRFLEAWQATGKKLDMGKACARFRRLDDVPLEVVGQVIARSPVADYIARVKSVFDSRTAKGSKSKVRATKR
jgi:hypothetical protein